MSPCSTCPSSDSCTCSHAPANPFVAPGPASPGAPALGSWGPAAPGFGYAWQSAPAFPKVSWWRRVAGSLIDSVPHLIGLITMIVGVFMMLAAVPGFLAESVEEVKVDALTVDTGLLLAGAAVIAVGVLVSMLNTLGNNVLLQGRTGQSVGKRCVGIRLLVLETGQVPGAKRCLGRSSAIGGLNLAGAFFGGLPMLLSYLWPLWDDFGQTLHDKAVHTVVVDASHPVTPLS